MEIKITQTIDLFIADIAQDIKDNIDDRVSDELPYDTYLSDLDIETQKKIYKEIMECIFKDIC